MRKDEEKLRESGQLDTSTPRGLLNAVFFLNDKKFALRGGAEHRNLRLSQVVKNMSANGKICYTYTEHLSKNRAGTWMDVQIHASKGCTTI